MIFLQRDSCHAGRNIGGRRHWTFRGRLVNTRAASRGCLLIFCSAISVPASIPSGLLDVRMSISGLSLSLIPGSWEEAGGGGLVRPANYYRWARVQHYFSSQPRVLCFVAARRWVGYLILKPQTRTHLTTPTYLLFFPSKRTVHSPLFLRLLLQYFRVCDDTASSIEIFYYVFSQAEQAKKRFKLDIVKVLSKSFYYSKGPCREIARPLSFTIGPNLGPYYII